MFTKVGGDARGGLIGGVDGGGWGGRMINRSMPLPISPRTGPHSYPEDPYLVNNIRAQPQAIDQQAVGVQTTAQEDDEMDSEDLMGRYTPEQHADPELEGLEWQLELDDKDRSRGRPDNPLARQMEHLGSRCGSAQPTPRSKDLPQSKRHCFASGSWDQSVESAQGSEVRRLFHDGSPDLRPVPAHANFLHNSGGLASSPVPNMDLGMSSRGVSSNPPSPGTAQYAARSATITSMRSPPHSPSTSAFPRYYTGGPLPRVETPKSLPCIAPVSSASAADHTSSYHNGSPPVPINWRGNMGSTPPSVLYARPSDVPRGGGVSPLREVMRNWGISS